METLSISLSSVQAGIKIEDESWEASRRFAPHRVILTKTPSVGPETYTTFWLGAIDKAVEKGRLVSDRFAGILPLLTFSSKPRERVKIDVLFTASYGLSREQLEDFNWQIKDSKSYPSHGEVCPRSYSS